MIVTMSDMCVRSAALDDCHHEDMRVRFVVVVVEIVSGFSWFRIETSYSAYGRSCNVLLYA